MDGGLQILLLRHGETPGNREKRYIGKTEEALSPEGIRALQLLKEGEYLPKVLRLYGSPSLRCLQTAEILFPGQRMGLIPDFRECDFGEFENKNYRELSGNADYQAWIDSNGMLPFPGGESREAFVGRCRRAFERLVESQLSVSKEDWASDQPPVSDQPVHSAPGGAKESGCLALVVHGGTIMSILSGFADPPGEYYDWSCRNGEGYLCSCSMRQTGKNGERSIQIHPEAFPQSRL